MGSLNEKRIVRYTQDGSQTEFVPPGRDGLAEVLGIRMDPTDGSVWVASGEDAQRAALFHFSPLANSSESTRRLKPSPITCLMI